MKVNTIEANKKQSSIEVVPKLSVYASDERGKKGGVFGAAIQAGRCSTSTSTSCSTVW